MDCPRGMKTATGKNYGAPGYYEGQQEILDKMLEKYGGKQGVKDYFAATRRTSNFLQTSI